MTLEEQINHAKKYGGMVMIDGHPHSYMPWRHTGELHIEEHHEMFADLPKEQQDAVEDWMLTQLTPRKTINKKHTSYGLKHCLQYDTGIYLYESQFCDAMLHCGYEPECYTDYHWYFKISQNSKTFKKN